MHKPTNRQRRRTAPCLRHRAVKTEQTAGAPPSARMRLDDAVLSRGVREETGQAAEYRHVRLWNGNSTCAARKTRTRGCRRGWGRRGLSRQGHGESFWGDGNVLYFNRGGSYTGICTCQKSIQTVYLISKSFPCKNDAWIKKCQTQSQKWFGSKS